MNITHCENTINLTRATGRSIQWLVLHYTAGSSSQKGKAVNTAIYFSRPTTNASADFIIDDESIVQYNPDPYNYYAWAVGGKRQTTKGGKYYKQCTNQNSISIEICSFNVSGKMTYANDPAYSFTDKVLDNAVNLVKYLMKEYNIDIDHVIRHYDVTGKLCPGILGWNIESGSEKGWQAFKSRLRGSQSLSEGQESATIPNDQYIWSFLLNHGYTETAAAGILGNLYAESGLRSNNLQNSYEAKFGLSDVQYTEAIDAGEYTRPHFVFDNAGYGLAQWTYWSRKEALYDYLKGKGKSIADLQGQLEFLSLELEKHKSLVNACQSVREACTYILTKFEKPADQSQKVQDKRAGYAKDFYQRLASNSMSVQPTDGTKLVRVLVDDLNIRSQPTSKAKSIGFTGKGLFTIVEESGKWGLLKTYAKERNGWIYLGNSKYVVNA